MHFNPARWLENWRKIRGQMSDPQITRIKRKEKESKNDTSKDFGRT
jgi:hypothetical protein